MTAAVFAVSKMFRNALKRLELAFGGFNRVYIVVGYCDLFWAR
jgi:hypothetical protein